MRGQLLPRATPAALVFLMVLQTPSRAIDYRDFPTELRTILDSRLTELREQGGVVVAGRVAFADKQPILNGEAVQVNYQAGFDVPLRVYEGGWFVADRVKSARGSSSKGKVLARAFSYVNVDQETKPAVDEITYIDIVMLPVPKPKQARIQGKVVDVDGRGIPGATIVLSFPMAYLGYRSDEGYTRPELRVKGRENGEFVFEGIGANTYDVGASTRETAVDHERIVTQEGSTSEVELYLSLPFRVLLDYVYQPDGSRDFTSSTIKRGRIEWTPGGAGIDLSRGGIADCNVECEPDLALSQKDDEAFLRVTHIGDMRNGFFDAGEVTFDSVREAATSGYATAPRPCAEHHVYVIRTYEGNYGKFIVAQMR